MPHPYWPLFDLRIRTPRLEVRIPTDDDLLALIDVIRSGIHDPDFMPFENAWTDLASPELERGALQWCWRARAGWTAESWVFNGVVFVDGAPVGVQDLVGERFGSLRTVKTGSWLGRAHQGQGLGKEMRAAVLHLAFAGLGAVEAYSSAWADNGPSLGVSAALGYQRNGEERLLRRGTADRHINLRVDRETWEQRRRDDIAIEGLDACLDMFGVPLSP